MKDGLRLSGTSKQRFGKSRLELVQILTSDKEMLGNGQMRCTHVPATRLSLKLLDPARKLIPAILSSEYSSGFSLPRIK